MKRTKNSFEADGVLVIDKPAGITSHDVVARVRRMLGTRRVGHTGTLDPFATGVLVVCVNRATRLAQFLAGDDKEYLAVARFGVATDTGDDTGQRLEPALLAAHLTPELIESALAGWRGCIRQVPPMYSAKKVGGVKLYELARRGEKIERQPVEVEIKVLELAAVTAAERGEGVATSSAVLRHLEDGMCECGLHVVCTAGTYVRTLAEDVGRTLGVGAHLTALRRTRAGHCSLSQAITLERLEELTSAGLVAQALLPMPAALMMPEWELTPVLRDRICHGQTIHEVASGNTLWTEGTLIKLIHQGELVAIAEYGAQSLRPRVVLSGN